MNWNSRSMALPSSTSVQPSSSRTAVSSPPLQPVRHRCLPALAARLGDHIAPVTLSPYPNPDAEITDHRPCPVTEHQRPQGSAGGCERPDAGAVSARLVSPFDVTVPDLFAADAVLIGTTENIGYMAGATKDMFDRCYNDWL